MQQTSKAADVNGTFNVRSFGAVGDGKALDTDAINRAIDAAAQAGGAATVVFPSGDYLSASLHLKSNVTLWLDAKATIIAADPISAGYDAAEPNPGAGKFQDAGHSHWRNSLIWGDNLQNIGITGTGTIRGGALIAKERGNAMLPNKAIALVNCTGVILRDFTIDRGGHFAILASNVANMQIAGLSIDTDRDGIDLDCCRDVAIERCRVNAPNDDGICLKSSWALGREIALQNVTVSQCALSGYDVGTMLDGTLQRKTEFEDATGPVSRIKLGTESAGGFSNVAIRDCKFTHTRGLAIECVDGGVLENVTVENIEMDSVTDAPIFIRLGSRLRRPYHPGLASVVRNVTLRNITAKKINPRFPVIIAGTGNDDVQNVTLENIMLEYTGGGVMPAPPPAEMPIIDHLYPEPQIFGRLPTYGIYASNVDGLTLKRVLIRFTKRDNRHPIVLLNVRGLACENVDAQRSKDIPPFDPNQKTMQKLE